MAYRRTLLQELKTLLYVESILAFSSLVILIINGCRLNRIRKDRYRSRILTGRHRITKFNNRFHKVLGNVNVIATNPQPPVRQMVATLTTSPTPAWMTTVCQMVDDRLTTSCQPVALSYFPIPEKMPQTRIQPALQPDVNHMATIWQPSACTG
jgi:hypothetical protein